MYVLSTYFVKADLISLLSPVDTFVRNKECPQTLTMTICEEGFEQLVMFVSVVKHYHKKHIVSVAKWSFFKYYVHEWPNIE